MKMSKQFKVFVLALAAFSGELIAYHLGKNAAYQEIKERPFACVTGQRLGTPNGNYICADTQEWKIKP
jgi:hypothetical protein